MFQSQSARSREPRNPYELHPRSQRPSASAKLHKADRRPSDDASSYISSRNPSIAIGGVADLPPLPPSTLHHARHASTPSLRIPTGPSSIYAPSTSLQGSPQDSPGTSPITSSVEKQSKRKSWLPGSRKSSKQLETVSPRAWVGGHAHKIPYDVAPLLEAREVPELWDEAGDTLVYLFPATSGKGPSFRIHSSVFASSIRLSHLAYGGGTAMARSLAGSEDMHGPLHQMSRLSLDPRARPARIFSDSSRSTLSFNDDAGPLSLRLPILLSNDGAMHETPLSEKDVETLLTTRNLFAFLTGQSLVCSDGQTTVFSVMIHIAQQLRELEFSNVDGSTYGEVAATSFDCYVDELDLGDVRTSRESTVEALVLGEQMRSVALYNEAFTHMAGKYNEMTAAAEKLEPVGRKFQMLSPTTRNRLERAAIDLNARRININHRLSDFEFPSVFAGVWSSKSCEERKHIDFDAWRSAFVATRKQVLSYYKALYGSWPPKANAKSQLQTPGLNRVVLKSLYRDFADLYDLLADRSSLSTRSLETPQYGNDPHANDAHDPAKRLQRKIFDEYDRSTPPVQPPIPFDTVLLPTLGATRKDYGQGDAKRDHKARHKKLKEDEITQLLEAASNHDVLNSDASRRPFLTAMRQWERKQAKGCTISQISDLRCGMWVFLYVVLQALPMLVVDAPGVRHTKGVEYFLCAPPRSGIPWVAGASGAGRNHFYRIAAGGGVVSLPSDLVEHGVEGIFRRSHCWTRAAQWSGEPGARDASLDHHAVAPAEPHRHPSAGSESSIEWNARFTHFLPPPPPPSTTTPAAPLARPTPAAPAATAAPPPAHRHAPGPATAHRRCRPRAARRRGAAATPSAIACSISASRRCRCRPGLRPTRRCGSAVAVGRRRRTSRAARRLMILLRPWRPAAGERRRGGSKPAVDLRDGVW